MERRSRPGSASGGGDDQSPILPVTTTQAATANGIRARRRGVRGGASSPSLWKTLCLFSLMSLVIVACVKFMTKDLERQNQALADNVAMSKAAMESKLVELQAHLDQTLKEKEELQKKQEKQSPAEGDGNDEDAVTQLQERLDKVHKEIQKISKRDALEKFGPGPHKVEIELDFPPEAPAVEGDPKTFVIELASLDDMPHSVHLFLEQVHRELWDGCAFMRNAGHVLQASSVPYYKTQNEKLRQKFNKAGFMSVAFQEYSPNVTHKKYTVGFAGRPGGPDWYVSTVDNTRNHGPGGQSSYKVPSEADPCFGKVISGFEAVDRMHKLPVKPGWYNALEHNVGIAKARII